MGEFCLYSDSCKDAPCIVVKMNKYSYLNDFLCDNRHKRGEQSYSVPLIIDCLKKETESAHKFSVKDEICINCMFCIFGCTGNRILISNEYHPRKFCYDITSEDFYKLQVNYRNKLFKGNFINLPPIPLPNLRAKYKRFEDFTAIDETKNIAVWTANALKYLSRSLEPRVSLEVGLKISQRDRNGRLDVSLLNLTERYLFIAETKVSFDKMMSEGRYESQMIAYESELGIVDSKDINRAKFLVIGGNESDLLPISHPNNSSGPRAKLFYDVLRKNNLFFISANALLALGIMKLFVSIDKYSLESLYSIITNDTYVGLLSCGLVTRDEKISCL